MFGVEHQRRPDFQRVGVRPGRAEQHALFPHQVDDARGLRRGGLATTPQFDAKEQAGAADFRYQGMARLQLPQRIGEIGAGGRAFSINPSDSITSSTAMPAAADTGLPPKVLK